MQESTGQVGNAVIYRNQIYTWGSGFGGIAFTGGPAAYGVNGSTDSNGGGSNAYAPTLLPVIDGPSGWTSIAGNFNSACALSNVGTVYCWGHNSRGQLGDGTTTNNFTARKVTINGNTRPITAIYTHNNYGGNPTNYTTFYAIDDLGRVWAWGDNQLGQIGNGVANGTVVSTPTQAGTVTLSGEVVTKLSVSGNSSVISVVAVTQSGKLFGWGYNGDGQLGLGNTTSPVNTPTMAVNPAMQSGVVDAITSNNTSNGFTTVLKSDGSVWTAGNNVNGVAGIGTTGTNLTTFTQANLGANVAAKIFARDQDTGGIVALVTTTGKVLFSGYNGYGQMGSNDVSIRSSFFEPTGAFQGKVSKVAIGGSGWSTGQFSYVLLLTTDGEVWSAGYGSQGQLGTGVTAGGGAQFFQKVIKNTDGAKAIDVRAWGNQNESGGLIVNDDGTMMSWGNNVSGAAGNDTNVLQVDTVSGATIHYPYSNTAVNSGINLFSSVARYVIGFEPGSRQNLYSGSLTPISGLAGATSGNSIENADFTQNWMWGTASDTNALVLSANSLRNGTLQSLNTNSTLFAGSLLKVTASGNATTSTGTLVDLVQTGASSSATGLKITTSCKKLAIS
jgi:alpha-tubulin suppressor-like RCC1 family protein